MKGIKGSNFEGVKERKLAGIESGERHNVPPAVSHEFKIFYPHDRKGGGLVLLIRRAVARRPISPVNLESLLPMVLSGFGPPSCVPLASPSISTYAFRLWLSWVPATSDTVLYINMACELTLLLCGYHHII